VKAKAHFFLNPPTRFFFINTERQWQRFILHERCYL